MPLNRTNTRSSWRTAFAGVTEYVILKRRGPDGKFNGVQELWVAFALPSTQEGESLGEGDEPVVRRRWHLFRRPGDKWRPPNIGDQIVRKGADKTSWDIHPHAGKVERKLFGSSDYVVDTIQVVDRNG